MKTIISIFIVIIFLISASLFFSYKMESQTDTLAHNILLQKDILADISYSKTSKSIFNDALKLHNVRFIHLPIAFNIQTLTLKFFSEQELSILAENVQFKLSDLIQKRDENSLLSAIRNYQPYLDILREPLLSLFLSGYNNIILNVDLSIHINPITSNGKMTILLEAPYLMTTNVIMDLENLPPHFINLLIKQFLKNGSLPLSEKIVKEITLETQDYGFIKNYRQFIRHLIPDKTKQAELANKAIYNYFINPYGSLRLDYETFSWVLKSAFYKREKNNK